MKILEKMTLVLYSLIILILAILLSLVIFGVISPVAIKNATTSLIDNQTASLSVLGVNIILVLLSIKCIFFRKTDKKSKPEEQGILLQNENGKLIISKDTIENLVNTIIKQFETIEGTVGSISLNEENNLVIAINLTVGENIVIKELSANIQEKIKTIIKTTLDLDVKEVNIRIKDYIVKKENVAQQ